MWDIWGGKMKHYCKIHQRPSPWPRMSTLAWPNPVLWHRADPQDKVTKPLMAPRYLFLPRVLSPNQGTVQLSQCDKFTGTQGEGTGRGRGFSGGYLLRADCVGQQAGLGSILCRALSLPAQEKMLQG